MRERAMPSHFPARPARNSPGSDFSRVLAEEFQIQFCRPAVFPGAGGIVERFCRWTPRWRARKFRRRVRRRGKTRAWRGRIAAKWRRANPIPAASFPRNRRATGWKFAAKMEDARLSLWLRRGLALGGEDGGWRSAGLPADFGPWTLDLRLSVAASSRRLPSCNSFSASQFCINLEQKREVVEFVWSSRRTSGRADSARSLAGVNDAVAVRRATG